jgi:non-specific serine/threonine protein kinase/serine/threonine-protein kinase
MDDIVLQALRKEPERRYGSVEQLDADIRRHLEGLPIRARPGTVAYRAGKFLRRHRLALAYQRIGDVQGNPNNANLSDSDSALKSYRNPSFPNADKPKEALDHYLQSSAILEDASRRDPADPRTRRFLGLVYEKIGTVRNELGEVPQAMEAYRRSLEIRQALLAGQPNNTDARRDAAIASEKIGDVLKALGDRKGALEAFSDALAIFESLFAADPENANAIRSLSISDVKMGDALAANHRPAEAGTFYRKALVIRDRLAAADTASVQARRDLLESLTGLAKFAAAAGRADEARYFAARAIEKTLPSQNGVTTPF